MAPPTPLGTLADESLTGREMLALDWAGTPLGPTPQWPPALRALVAAMLACPTPMFLAWGPELVCLYNDAYRPILGHRLAGALGRPFRQVWASIWGEIAPLVEATLAGESQTLTDLKLDLARQGEPEESYWSFTYSPAFDDDGAIAGLFCVTGETTSRVLAERERRAADERLDVALSSGNSIGAWDWDVVTDRVTADARFALLYGVDPGRAATGAPIAEFFARIHPEDAGRVRGAVAAVVKNGGALLEEYRLVDEDGRTRWVSAQGGTVRDAQGRCLRFTGVSFDVTERVKSDLATKAAKAEREFVISLTARHRALSEPEAVLRATAQALGERLGINRVGFYRPLGPDQVLYGPSWTDGTLPPLVGALGVETFGGRAMRQLTTSQALIFSDSRHDGDGELTPFAKSGVLAGLAVPVLSESGWTAGLVLHHATVRAWTPGEVSLAKEVAVLTWLAVERTEALARLQERVGRQDEELALVATDLELEAAGREAAENQVRQLQKMEAVGQLTGGIAHDFNNMLAIIIGGLNMTQRRLARGDTDVARFMDGAMEGATRAAALTQRLLAFSRQQPLTPEAIDGNAMMTGLRDLLTRTLGEAVQLETVLDAGLWRARADANQLENVIVNLAVNARDAMPEGGKLTIETANASVDEDYARAADIAPGQYVRFAVTDTGTGMTPEVMAKAFDPFFTTKEVGRGTGLGLSQVFGFVRQSLGHVKVYSEVGHGTTFKIYLPRFYGESAPAAPRRRPAIARGGSAHEIVLVVEDEARVRSLSIEALRDLGYTVIHASSGREALDLIEGGREVALLFTDIVMPGMTGRQLADRALETLPRLKVLYTTGYTRNAVVHNGVLDPGTNFLAKPFNVDQLAAKVRSVLDEG